MQLSLRLSLLVFVLSVNTLWAQELTFSSATMVTISDNGCPIYAGSTINVPDAQVPNDGFNRLQKVGITITHQRPEDLDIRLVAPNGTTVELSTDNGGGGANYQSTYFVFGGIIAENGPISSGVAPFFGNYLPEGNANTVFADLNGNWRLEICDDQATFAGVLLGFSLTFGRTSDCGLSENFIWCTNTPITGNASGAGNNADIDTYVQLPNFCLIPNPGQADYSGPDVWFKMTVPEASFVSINLLPATTNADLDVFVFTRDCSGQNSNVCLFSINEGGNQEEISAYLDAGEYSIVVDSKTPVADPAQNAFFTLSVTSSYCLWCNNSNACLETQNDLPLGSVVQCENFDNLSSVSGIAAQGPLWEKWLYNATDAPVVANPLGGAGKVLKIQRTHAQTQDPRVNVMHYLNNRQEGRYRLSWNMYVPSGNTGSYGVQHTQMGGATANRAYQVYFNGNGTGSVQVGGAAASEAAFIYQTSTWNRVVNIIDLGLDKAELWINGQFIYSWQFSKGDAFSQLQLGAIHFWDLPLNTLFYIDNVCLWEIGCNISPCTGDPNPKCVENGDFYDNECAARCAGYVSEEWENCTACGISSCVEPLDDQPEGDLINCENLDAYTVGGIDAQTYRWERKTPGSDDGALVTNPYGIGKVLKMERNGSIDPDMLFKLGNYTSGRYRLSWRMYVPAGKAAYYNIQHNQIPGNRAFEVFFDADGKGRLRIGNSTQNAGNFTYLQESWTKVMQIIDINANKTELWINGQFVYSWQFAIGSTQNSQQLYYINFYAQDNNLYYVDNLCLRKMTCTGIICPGHPPVCMRNGMILDSDCEARCFGYTNGEWDNCSSVCDFGGTLVHRGDINLGDSLSLNDIPPTLIRTEPAVLSAFGGSLPSPLLCEVFIFNNETNGTIDINANLPTGAKGFIFNCECGTPSNPTGCNQEYFGPIDSVYTNAPEGFYYIAVVGATEGPINIGVFPAGLCSTQLNEIASCDLSINPTVGNILSASQGSYQSCYSGPRAYEGEEVYYTFTLETRSEVYLGINSTMPSGLFLFNHLCAQTCLLYFENDPASGIDNANMFTPFLDPGVYYVVIDTDVPSNRYNPPDDIIFEYSACEAPTPYDPPFITSALTSGSISCDVVATEPHRVGLYPNALSNSTFSTSDLITFFYNNQNGDLATNDYANRFWNATPLMVFDLPRDLDGDAFKCSYAPTDPFAIYITRNNGFTTTRLTPHYAPLGTAPLSASLTVNNMSGNYAINGASIIDELIEAEAPVNFFVSPSFLNPPAEVDMPIKVTLTSSLPWVLDIPEEDEDWISVQANALSGSGNRNIYFSFEPNTDIVPRESEITITSVNNDPVFQRKIRIRQLGVCAPPMATLEGEATQVCAGDSVLLSVVADSALLAAYRIRWSTGDSIATVKVVAPPNDSISVIVTEPNCNLRDTLYWVFEMVNSPEPPFIDAEVNYCITDSELPDLSVFVEPGQTVDWFSAETGGDTLQLGSADIQSYSPPAPGTYWAQARLLDAPGCSSLTRTPVVLTSNAAATADAGLPQSICAGQALTLNGSIGGLANSATWSAAVSGGAFSNSSQLNATYTPPSEFDGLVRLFLTTNDPVGACPSAIDSVDITVTPGATVDAGSDLTVCRNSIVTLSGQIGGLAFNASWSASVGGGSFSNAGSLSATYTPPLNYVGDIVLTLASNDPAGPCPAVSDQVMIRYLAPPVAMAGSDASICSGSQVVLNGAINASAEIGIWSASTPGGSFQPNNQALNATYMPPPGATGVIILTLTATQSQGTCPASTDELTLTVTQGPIVIAGDDLTLCIGSPVLLNGQIAGNASSGAWSASVPGGVFSPNAATLNATYLPPSDFTGAIVLTLISNDPPGDCPAATGSRTITFEAAPSANAGANQTICAGSAVNLTGIIGGSATGGVWSSSVPNGIFSPNAESLNASYTPPVDYSGDITLTLTTIQQNSCQPATAQMTLNVNPEASVEAGDAQTLCVNSLVTLAGQIDGGAMSATWSASVPGGVFIPSPNIVNASYLPPNDYTGPITLTLITNDPPGVCPAANDAITVTYVTPPIAIAGNDSEICAGNAITLNGDIDGSATGGSWSASVSGGTFSPNNTTLNATYTPPPNHSGAITLTLTATTNGVGACPVASDELVVQVIAPPTANAGGVLATCSGIPVQLNGTFGGSASSASWSATVSGGLFVPNANTPTATYLPPAGYTGFIGLTLTTNAPAGGCQPAVSSTILTVHPALNVDAGVQTAVCENTQIQLNASATGGNGNFTFNWSNGLGAGASQTLVATQTTTYTVSVSDAAGCTASDQVTVPVVAQPVANAGLDQTQLCAGNIAQLNGSLAGSATIGTWQASVSGGVFTPSNTALNASYTPPSGYTGEILLSLTTNASAPCPAGSDQLRLVYEALPDVLVTDAVCAPDLLSYDLMVSTSGTSLASNQGDVMAQAQPGVFSIENINTGEAVVLTVTNENTGCTFVQTINPPDCDCQQAGQSVPNAEFIDNVELCQNEPLQPLTVNVQPGFQVNWYASDNPDTPLSNGIGTNGTYLTNIPGIYYAETVNPVSGCTSPGRIAVSLVIKELPIADAGADLSACRNALVSISAVEGDFYAYQWSTGDTTPLIEIEVSEPVELILSVTKDECIATDTILVSLYPDLESQMLVLQPIVCYLDSSGVLQVQPAGGTPPYELSWQNGSTESIQENLPAGSYSVQITDANNCTQLLEQSLENPDNLSITLEALQADTNAIQTGAIDISVNGGLPAYSYQWYDINGVAIDTTQDIDSLLTGLYVLEVTDGLGCITSDTFLIEQIIIDGTQQLPNGGMIRVFPNPVAGLLFVDVKLSSQTPVEMQLWDVYGRLLPTRKAMTATKEETVTFDLYDYPPGVYFLRIHLYEQEFTWKIIHQ